MINSYSGLISELNKNNSVVMITKFPLKEDGEIEKKLIDISKLNSIDISNKLKEKINNAIDKRIPELFIDENNQMILLETFFPKSRMIVLGGGNISEALVNFGSSIGFEVTVVDDRLSYANKERFPNAKEVICESFELVFEKLKINRNDYVVIVTRGHKYDKECLREVIGVNPKYLGMIGSKTKVQVIKDQLIEEGYDKEILENMCAPIGFRIGGMTPKEIAISIIAQIIAKKRLGVTDMADCKNAKKVSSHSEIDREVLERLGFQDKEKRAVVTIYSTKGSTPRRAGAKMIVLANGKTIGNIGGGDSEEKVKSKVRELIEDERKFTTIEVEITAEMAANEGMVCGGKMNLIIEVI